MDRKNVDFLFLSMFVTDYGKDNSYFNVKSKIVARDSRVYPCVEASPLIKDGS